MQPHRRQPTRLPRPWDSPGKNTGVGCHFLLQCRKVKSEREVTQSCPTLRDPMDCSLPGSSVHGIFQARVLESGAIAFSAAQVHLPNKVSCFASTCVSSDNLFLSVRQESTLRPWKGPPFLQQRSQASSEVESWLRTGDPWGSCCWGAGGACRSHFHKWRLFASSGLPCLLT